MARKIVVVGGSAAGPKTAAKARRVAEQAEVTLIQREVDLSIATCGYPYYVSGVIGAREQLISAGPGQVRNPAFFKSVKAIVARTETEVLSIDRVNHTVTCKHRPSGAVDTVAYDALVLATGATPLLPPVPGVRLKGVSTLQSMQDVDYLRRIRDEQKIRRAVVVGGGLIGVETCEALRQAGMEVTLVERLPQVLGFLDWDLAKLVEQHLTAHGVKVITSNGVAEFVGAEGHLTGLRLADGAQLPAELAVVAVGVKPNVQLAREAGLTIGPAGGIQVNEFLQTSDPHIYAAGDCLEIRQRQTGRSVHAPFGDLANLEGRVAGENAALGNRVTFPGTFQTGICKVFDYAAGTTGLSAAGAAAAGFEPVTITHVSVDKPGYMQGKLLITRLTADRRDGRILGAQCIGPGDVSRQIAQWAMALLGELRVEDMVNADLPYAPPFSLPIDHTIAAAHLMQNKLNGRLQGVSGVEVKRKLDAGEKPFILDVRRPDEFEAQRLGIGETLIPLGELRRRVSELPADREREIISYCKVSLRAYEASLILQAAGHKHVRVMEGGLTAWPYPREK